MNDIQRTVKSLIEAKNVSLTDVASAIGLSPISVRDQTNGTIFSHRRARKIENFFGAPIWTPLARFAELNRASEILGTDAVLTGFGELRRRAIKLRIPSARKLTSKDDLVNTVLAHVASQTTTSLHP